jgi:molybdopterin molybdotransferase
VVLRGPDWDSARQAAFESTEPAAPKVRELSAAFGSVLARPLISLSDVPGFDTSMMDGWAVAGQGPWRVTGSILAGGESGQLVAGEAKEIATGAALPSGADAVLRREWGSVERDLLHTAKELKRNQDIRLRGDEVRAGEVVLEAGALVTPPVVGLAALIGLDEVTVVPRARVGSLIFGDELISAGVPRNGQVRDALGVQVLEWTRPLHALSVGVKHVPDLLDATVHSIDTMEADVILTTGGTARGPVDHLHSALGELNAEMIVDSVDVRPGHPMLLARLRDGRFVVGLPGNPLAALAGYLTLAEPLISRLTGRGLSTPGTAITDEEIRASGDHLRIVPGRLRDGRFTPSRYTGSAMLRGLATANAIGISARGGNTEGSSLRTLPAPW